LYWGRLQLLFWLYPAGDPEDIRWVSDFSNNIAPEDSLRAADGALKIDPSALNFLSMSAFCGVSGSAKVVMCLFTLIAPPRVLSSSSTLTYPSAGFGSILKNLQKLTSSLVNLSFGFNIARK
jgi:hypothetical protein